MDINDIQDPNIVSVVSRDEVNMLHRLSIDYLDKPCTDFVKCMQGICLLYGVYIEEDQARAVNIFKELAEKGYSLAQYYYGNCFYFGEGVLPDHNTARALYEKAAKQGLHLAENRMGDMCRPIYNGNMDEALYWYSQAAKAGDAEGKYNLGTCYYYSKGNKNNVDIAKILLCDSANQGYEPAIKFVKAKNIAK